MAKEARAVSINDSITLVFCCWMAYGLKVFYALGNLYTYTLYNLSRWLVSHLGLIWPRKTPKGSVPKVGLFWLLATRIWGHHLQFGDVA